MLASREALHDRCHRLVGLAWMTGYFATLLRLWAHQLVAVFARAGTR